MNVHALVDSVEKAWKGDCVDDIIRKVWNRLRNFLALVVDVDGGNNLVEKKKKCYRGLDVSAEFLAGDETTTASATMMINTNTENMFFNLVLDDEESNCNKFLLVVFRINIDIFF